jgi:stage IV sporulation protein FB
MISIPGRIPIHIFPFFWILILMIGWLNSATLMGTMVWSVVILISVLIHEYGHALTALAFGQTAEISLVGLGGLTKRDGPKLAKWKEFIIVLNGPLAGFMLFIVAYQLLGLVGERKSVLAYGIEVAVNVNLFWTILNLLPVLPLDGGHLLRILLEGAFGLKGLKLAFFASIVLAVLIALYFFLIQQVLMGALFFMLAFESYRAWADVKSLSPQDTDQQLQDLIKQGIEELKAGHPQDALAKFTYVRQQAPKGVLYVNATQYAARILVEQGHLKQAYDWLFPLKNRLSADYVRLLQQLAYRTQEWEEAVKIGQEAYQLEPSVDIALTNALSYAIIGEATPAVGWLRCAIQLGLQNVQQIIAKREFDAIRDSTVFQTWLKSREKGTS